MKCIELNKGCVAIVDDEDFAELAQYRWRMQPDGYVVRTSKGKHGTRKTIYMHRQVMGAIKWDEIDHRNLNKSDNRKENLRSATRSQNLQNTRAKRNNSTGVKGVSRAGKKFSASVMKDGVGHWLGRFKTIEEAKAAYDKAAKELHHPEFYRLN